MNGSCRFGSNDELTARNKHKEHWIPYDRSRPPPWLTTGAVGNDDKRALLNPIHLLIRADPS